MDKEIKIVPPAGYIIDKENSTFECIKFKPIGRWRDNEYKSVSGYYIDLFSEIIQTRINYLNVPKNYNIFNTEKQAKSALAMARISQIMANDSRFGGVVTDDEWERLMINKYIIRRGTNDIKIMTSSGYNFLAFHTAEQRDLFLEENKSLVKDYLMVD